MKTGRPVPKLQTTNYQLPVSILKIGLCPPPKELRRWLNARLAKDLRRELIAEVKKLHADGLNWKRLDELGLEYRLVAQYLRGEIQTKEVLLQKLRTELWRYAKRQLRWFKRDKNVHWAASPRAASALVRKFLT